MTLAGRHNIAKMRSGTTGTGTLTLSSAVNGYNSFEDAGVVNAEVVTYTIRDGSQTEVGRGTYTSSGTTLSRDTVLSSTNGGSKIECTGRQQVMISLASEDIQPFASYYGGSGDSVNNAATDTEITIDTEWVDDFSLASVAANAVTLAKKGWYQLWLQVLVAGGAAFNGKIEITMSDFGTLTAKGYTTAMAIQQDMIIVGPVMINASTDSYSLGTVSVTNNLGATVTVTVNELSVFKIGNK